MRDIPRALVLAALASVMAPSAHADDAPSSTSESPEGGRLGVGGLPALNYNSDDGFGFGAIASVYWYEPDVEPYRYALTLLVFGTTNLIQDHSIRFDAVDVLGLPLRVSVRGGYYQTLNRHFCGTGNAVTCDPDVAITKADVLHLEGQDREDFLRRYYQVRFHQPWVDGNVRWRLTNRPHKLELFVGYRGYGYIPGNIFADDDGDGAWDLALRPYAQSHYTERVGEDGEVGWAGVPQLGVMYDSRDTEASPGQGMWLEASMRGSSRWLLSSWDFAGANLTARTYTTLAPGEHRVVLATRSVVDALVGDVPILELPVVGGSITYPGYGGGAYGRGIRARRVVGKLKIINQTELRANLLSHTVFGEHFTWIGVGFIDAGWVMAEWDDFGGDPLKLNLGFGGGLRLLWGRDFVVRVDVAVSPEERYDPGVYIDIGHPF